LNDQLHSGSLVPFLEYLADAGPVGLQILQHDWCKTSIGPIESWSDILQITLKTVLSSRQPMSFYWGPDLIQFFNGAYKTILGDRATGGIGAPLWEFWADIEAHIRPIAEEALSGRSTLIENFPLTMTRSGVNEETFWMFSYSPLFNVDSSIAGFMNICTEMTQAIRATRSQRTGFDLLMEMFQQSPSFLAVLREPEHRIEFINFNYMTLIGHREVLGLTFKNTLPDIFAQNRLDFLDDVYLHGNPYRLESSVYAVQSEPGGPIKECHIEFIFQPITDTTGQINGVLIEGHDVTALKDASKELAASESFLSSILNSSRDCIKVLDLDGSLIYMSDGGRQVMEVDDVETIKGCVWPDFWTDSGNVAAKAAITNARDGLSGRFEGFANTMRGTSRFWDVQVTPIFGADDKTERILVVSRDITALKESELQRADLMREMSHRLKNSLTLVQAIASQTFQYAKSMDEARDAIAGRISALGRSQDVLIAGEKASSDIEKLIAVVLAPHRDVNDRFHLSGPHVTLSQKQAVGLSLALHELATNATKYGALSSSGGSVSVNWTLSPDLDFNLRWTESGGPTVQRPIQTGFGSKLIERIVAGYFNGNTELKFFPSGVVFTLDGRLADADVKSGHETEINQQAIENME
jgi:PAS domain S-box-containing protein